MKPEVLAKTTRTYHKWLNTLSAAFSGMFHKKMGPKPLNLIENVFSREKAIGPVVQSGMNA